MKTRIAFYLLTVFLLSMPVLAQVSGFSIVKPTGAPNAVLTLSGSQRRIELDCASGCSTTQAATWSVSATAGGASATLTPSSSGNYVDVVIGGAGGACNVISASSSYTITASASVTVKATSTDDPNTSDTLTFDVCQPAVEAYTIPFYRVLYSGQKEDIQGVIWGSANTDGTWSIQSQPSGGDAKLDDTKYQDTVFHATVAGLYKVKWTSSADPTKTAYSTFYVTGNAQPRPVQPNGTQPIDCTADPNTSGGTLEVGPSQTYKNLEAITPAMFAPGTTIRVHNEDTTGSAPTQYHEWIQINNAGTHDNPIRICGVPDAAGHLPILDGSNATARADILNPTVVSGLAGIFVYNSGFTLYPNYTSPQFVVVEGLAFRNYGPTASYYPAGSTANATAYVNGASGFRFQQCRDCELNGSEVYNNGNGIFAESNDEGGGWNGVAERLLFEGNNSHDNGVTGDDHEHNWYLQTWFQVVQFNQTPTYNTAALGSLYKDRGISWFRYNLLGTGAQREMDIVEDQDAPDYLSPFAYLTNQRPVYPDDAYTGDQLAAAQEAWHHSAIVYGNVIKQATTGTIHFAADNIGGYTGRVGSLEFYNNSINAVATAYNYALFDTGDNGDNFTHYEWPIINASNLVAGGWVDTTNPYFSWNSQRDAFINFGRTLLPPNWGTNVQNCTDRDSGACQDTGWPTISNTDVYFNGNLFHNTGVSNFVTASSMTPFDTSTYVLNTSVAGSPLTGAQAKLPVRFQFLPASGYAVARNTVVNETTGGEIGAIDTAGSPPAPTAVSIAITPASISLTAGQSTTLACTTTLSDGTSRACTSPSLSSSNPSALTVSGMVATGNAAGTGQVTASAEGFTATANFTVSAAAVTTTSIALTPSSLTLTANQSATLICTATLSDGSTRACASPILSSSNTASLTVAGMTVTATSNAGSGTITAKAEGLSTTASFTVKTAPITVVSIGIAPNPIAVTTNQSVALACTATLSDGTTRACASPTLTSSNPASLTVSGMTATATSTVGSGTITAKAEGLSTNANFTVKAAPVTVVSIGLAPNPIALTTKQSVTLTCLAKLSDGTTRACASPALTSNNPAVLTVSGMTVTATSTTGSGTVTVSAEGLAAGDNFNVSPPPVTVVSIVLSPASITLKPGQSFTLTCTTTLSDGSSRACISPAVTSSNTTSATVSILTVTATQTPGSGMITATAEGFRSSASFTVTMPVPVSISLSMNPITLTTGRSVVLTCTTTLSDGTKRPCINPTLASSNPLAANTSGLTVQAVLVGSGTITASAEGLTTSDPFTVSLGIGLLGLNL